MKHWAYDLIGEPWTPRRNCWWLVSECIRRRHSVEMPNALAGEPALWAAAFGSGWRRVRGDTHEDDVVLMRGINGRHVGYITQLGPRLVVLHSNGRHGPWGPTGSVVVQSLHEVACDGYEEFELWRKT